MTRRIYIIIDRLKGPNNQTLQCVALCSHGVSVCLRDISGIHLGMVPVVIFVAAVVFDPTSVGALYLVCDMMTVVRGAVFMDEFTTQICKSVNVKDWVK